MFAFWLVLYALALACLSWLSASLGQHGLLILLFVYQCLLLSCFASVSVCLSLCLSTFLSVSVCGCLSVSFFVCVCQSFVVSLFVSLFICQSLLSLSLWCASLCQFLLLVGCGGTLCACLSSVSVDYITTQLLYFVNSFFIIYLFVVQSQY